MYSKIHLQKEFSSFQAVFSCLALKFSKKLFLSNCYTTQFHIFSSSLRQLQNHIIPSTATVLLHLPMQYHIISSIPQVCSTTSFLQALMATVPHHISHTMHGCCTTSSLQALTDTVPPYLLHTTQLRYHIIPSSPLGYSTGFF
jgi:hypothetical protein